MKAQDWMLVISGIFLIMVVGFSLMFGFDPSGWRGVGMGIVGLLGFALCVAGSEDPKKEKY